MALKRIVRICLWVMGVGLVAGIALLNVLAYNHAYAKGTGTCSITT